MRCLWRALAAPTSPCTAQSSYHHLSLQTAASPPKLSQQSICPRTIDLSPYHSRKDAPLLFPASSFLHPLQTECWQPDSSTVLLSGSRLLLPTPPCTSPFGKYRFPLSSSRRAFKELKFAQLPVLGGRRQGGSAVPHLCRAEEAPGRGTAGGGRPPAEGSAWCAGARRGAGALCEASPFVPPDGSGDRGTALPGEAVWGGRVSPGAASPPRPAAREALSPGAPPSRPRPIASRPAPAPPPPPLCCPAPACARPQVRRWETVPYAGKFGVGFKAPPSR